MYCMLQIIHHIESLVDKIGRTVSWLSLVLILLVVVDVVMRYLFNTSYAGVFEMEWHLFATLFMIGAAYTLKHDKHVRVDVFYGRFSEKGKAVVNMVGTLLFLLPFCFVVIKTSIPFVLGSYTISESSPDPSGLPYRFIIKSTIPIGMSLLLLQGLAVLLKSLSVLLRPKTVK